MSDHVYKTPELTGSSDQGFQEVIQRAIGKAHETIRNIRWFEVLDTRGQVADIRVRLPARPYCDRTSYSCLASASDHYALQPRDASVKFTSYQYRSRPMGRIGTNLGLPER